MELNNPVSKKEYEHLVNHKYYIAFKINVQSELIEVNNRFKLIDKVESPPKDYGQLYLAEFVLKNKEIISVNNMFNKHCL